MLMFSFVTFYSVYETEPHSVNVGFPIPIKLNPITHHMHAQGLILWMLLDSSSLHH